VHPFHRSDSSFAFAMEHIDDVAHADGVCACVCGRSGGRSGSLRPLRLSLDTGLRLEDVTGPNLDWGCIEANFVGLSERDLDSTLGRLFVGFRRKSPTERLDLLCDELRRARSASHVIKIQEGRGVLLVYVRSCVRAFVYKIPPRLTVPYHITGAHKRIVELNVEDVSDLDPRWLPGSGGYFGGITDASTAVSFDQRLLFGIERTERKKYTRARRLFTESGLPRATPYDAKRPSL
jgi:hypothetical protein